MVSPMKLLMSAQVEGIAPKISLFSNWTLGFALFRSRQGT
jgi:hypothetical protein